MNHTSFLQCNVMNQAVRNKIRVAGPQTKVIEEHAPSITNNINRRNDMNKEAYKEKIKSIDHAIEWHTEEAKAWQRVKAEAETAQAESEKPKLQHGDIRLWNVSGDIGIVDLSEPHPHMIWNDSDLRNSKTEDAILSQSKSIGKIEDVFCNLGATAKKEQNGT